jgi:hypothetical protein
MLEAYPQAYVSIRQHTHAAYVSIRQHTYAYICSKPTRRSWEKYTKILFDSVTKKKVEHTARICEFADPFFFSLRPHSF